MSSRIRLFAAALLCLAAVASRGQAQAPDLVTTTESDPHLPGDTVVVEVVLRHTDGLMPAVSGIGFKVGYDAARLRLLDAAVTGAFGADTLLMVRHDAETKALALAVTQKNGQGIRGTPTVARLRWVVRDLTLIGQAAFELTQVQILLTDGTLVEPDPVTDAAVVAPTRVWPGDADRDGAVTERDVLMVGHHFGHSGPARPDRSLVFEPKAAERWSVPDAAHADVNGDGLVDPTDLAGIHALHQAPEPTDPLLSILVPASIPGDRYQIHIRSDADVMGMSASLGIPLVGLVAEAPAFGSWLESASPALSFVRVHPTVGVVSLAASRIRGQMPIPATETGLSVDLSVTETLPAPVPVVLYRAAVADLNGIRNDIPIRLDIRKIVSADGDDPHPSQTILDTAYPNPFNPQTLIRYRLAASGPIRLTVHDALGREVRVLADLHQTAGDHAVAFDATGLASGVYICRLQTESAVRIRLMTLIH